MVKTTVLALFLMTSPMVAFAGNVIRIAAPIVKTEGGVKKSRAFATCLWAPGFLLQHGIASRLLG